MLQSELWFTLFVFSRGISSQKPPFLNRLFSNAFIHIHTVPTPIQIFSEYKQTPPTKNKTNKQKNPEKNPKHAALSQNCTGCLLMGHSKWDTRHSPTRHHTVTMHDADAGNERGTMLRGGTAHVHTWGHSACWVLTLNLFLEVFFFRFFFCTALNIYLYK